MLGHLYLDIICSSKLTVFRERSFSEQLMSADKYRYIFSRQMEAIFYIAEMQADDLKCVPLGWIMIHQRDR